MRRRVVAAAGIVAIAVALLVACGRPAGGPAPLWRFCFIGFSDNPLTDAALDGVREALGEAGSGPGLQVMNAQGDAAALGNIVNQAASGGYDLIFVSSTPALQAACKAITTKPIVFTNSADPVSAGAGESLEKHRPNVTGICTMIDMTPLAQLIRRLMPSARAIGSLYTPAESNSVIYLDELKRAAAGVGLQVVAVPVSGSNDIADAAAALCSRDIDAVCQIADNCVGSGMTGVVKAAENGKKPLFAFLEEQANSAVAIEAIDFRQCGRDAVGLAQRIFKGESPAAIPIVPHPKTRLIVNRRRAAAFGITVPPDINADTIVQ